MITDDQVKLVAELIAQNWSDNEAKARKILEIYEQRKWVDVDEKLPMRGCQVLVLSNDLPVIGYRNSDDTLRVFGTHKLILNATHWQPLPNFIEQ